MHSPWLTAGALLCIGPPTRSSRGYRLLLTCFVLLQALIGALKKCLVEYYYPRPKQILKYMLNARDHDNDRLFHSHADVRDVWNSEKNKLIRCT